jgi:hypothetical protein
MEEVCDICATPGSGTKLSAEDIRSATNNGFDPAGLHLLPARPGYDRSRSRAMWRTLADQNETDWNLCAGCLSAVRPYLAIAVVASQDEPVRAPGDLTAQLLQCGDLFFEGKFLELSRLATGLIRQDANCGDAYAFRSFALVERDKPESKEERGQDLQLAILDFFKSGELSMATEAGAVCRLFLTLMLNHLVIEMAKAGEGSKVGLDFNDPLYAGAHAILEKDQARAQTMLAKATASSDPAIRMYGFAGIGLMRVFLLRDPAGAAEAFAKAGNSNADVRTLVKSLQQNSSSAPAATKVQPKAAKSGCFIATAACGSPLAAEVESLRAYRDSVLRPSRLGRLFVRCYERTSPPVAVWIESRPAARKLVRNLLVRPLAAMAATGLRRMRLRQD